MMPMTVATMMTTHDGQFMTVETLWHFCQMSQNATQSSVTEKVLIITKIL